jgi:hypothetical protein
MKRGKSNIISGHTCEASAYIYIKQVHIYINKTGSLSPKKVVKSAISMMSSFTGRTAFYELE